MASILTLILATVSSMEKQDPQGRTCSAERPTCQGIHEPRTINPQPLTRRVRMSEIVVKGSQHLAH